MAYVEARQFTSGSDIISAAKDVHKRLWSAHKPIIKPTRLMPPRAWTLQQNSHVAAYLTNKTLLGYEQATIEAGEPRHEDQESRVWISQIIVECSKHYGVSVLDIKSKRRTRVVVRPRQVAMYLCRMLTPRSLPEIGRKFGDRDHTTALWAINKIDNLISSGDPIIADIEAISKALKGAA